MRNEERFNLVAPCGIDCATCELYMCQENKKLYDYLISKGFSSDKIPCPGCREVAGHCPVLGAECATYLCARNKGVDFCYECNEFPCSKLNPAVDRAEILPHNMKVFNLATIQNLGLEEFVKISLDIKHKYYKGKMKIGEGPMLDKQ